MSRPPRRLLPRAVAGAFAALLLAGLWGHGSVLALQIPAEDTGAGASAEAEEPVAELIVAPQEALFAWGVDEYPFEALVRNPRDDQLAAGTLRLWLRTEPLETREQLTEFGGTIDPDADPVEDAENKKGEGGAANEDAPRGILLAEAPVEATAAGEERSLTVDVSRESLPLFLDAGVYGVQAELTVDGAESGSALATATTALIWRGLGTGEQVPISVVVPFVLPEDVRSMPTRDDLSTAAPRLDALLTAAERWQATLAIDPRLISGIRAYGSTAPTSARDLLARLEASTLPTFLLQFADADPAAEAALGFDSLLQPTGLGFLTRLGSFEAESPANGATGNDVTGNNDVADDPDADDAAAGDPDAGDPLESGTATDDAAEDDAATDEEDPENPLAPRIHELLSWPAAEPGAWPAEGQASAATLELLRAAGVTSLVLRSDNVAEASGPRVTVAGFDTLVADAGLGSAARLALGGQSTVERAAGAASLAAELALAAGVQAPGLVLALDRGAVADAEAPSELLDALDALSWVAPVAAADLPQGTGSLHPGETSEQRIGMLRGTIEASDRIDALAPLLEHPGYLTQYQRTRLLEALSTRYSATDIDLAAVERRNTARDEELLAGVQVLPSENTQLVGTESRIPLLVHNALPFDARVTLRVTPTNAAIAVPERRFGDEPVAAGGNTTVLVPVSSRVSSGESGLSIQVADAANDAVFFQTALRLTLRTSYETIMLVALGAAASLLLGFGVWRSVRRHRRPGPAADSAAE